jgi:hypothetical protein
MDQVSGKIWRLLSFLWANPATSELLLEEQNLIVYICPVPEAFLTIILQFFSGLSLKCMPNRSD